jgi:hypothetical protein
VFFQIFFSRRYILTRFMPKHLLVKGFRFLDASSYYKLMRNSANRWRALASIELAKNLPLDGLRFLY